MSEDLLKEIRDNRQYAEAEWEEVRSEAKKDRLCVAGKIWQAMDPAGFKERKDTNRPKLSSDELGQYLNQTVNDIRANPRAIKYAPTGNGANDAGAEFYQNHTREIEYRSQARVGYAKAFENAVNSSYGWIRIRTKREHLRTFNQDLWIELVANPDQVLPDPNGVWPDSRDIKFLYYLEPWTKADFKRKWPKAKAADFKIDSSALVKGWMDRNTIQVGEYWHLETIERTLIAWRMKGEPEGTERFDLLHELPDKKLPENAENLREEAVDDTAVRCHVTNGLEILEEIKWAGKYIPFVSCYGKVLYIDEGGGSRREILSMTRLARDPAMAHAYMVTCEAEAVGGIPRGSWVGYEGQFAKPERWTKANRQPVAFLEAKVTVPGNPTPQPLPLPIKQSWDPPLQNLEVAIDARRRAIQAAMGILPQPTDAQRANDVSGVAYKERYAQGQKGSFHFVDAYDLMIERGGVILEDLIPHILDTARDIPVRKPDDASAIVRINSPQGSTVDEQGEVSGDPIFTKGDYRVTVTTGPVSESQRQDARDFVDSLVTNLQTVAAIAGPQKAGAVLAKSVKLKQLGPIGDEIIELLAPPAPNGPNGKPLPPEAQALMAQIQQLQQQLQQAQQALQTKQVEQEGKMDVVRYQTDARSRDAAADREVKLAVAELSARIDRMALLLEESKLVGARAHEGTQAGLDRTHDARQQAHDRIHQTIEGAKDRAHDHILTTVAQAHALEAADQAGQIAADQAAVASPPDAGSGA